MKYRIHFDCEHCGSPKIANSKQELIDIIITELKKPNFAGFECKRGTGLYGCRHWFEEKVIIITPIDDKGKYKKRIDELEAERDLLTA